MTEYLKACRDKLVPGGYVIFDMVDRSFDSMSNNQYMTDDWQLTEAKRRPSQYVVRISPNEMRLPRPDLLCGANCAVQESLHAMSLTWRLADDPESDAICIAMCGLSQEPSRRQSRRSHDDSCHSA